MKKLILFLVCQLISTIAFSQVDWRNYSQIFSSKVFNHPDSVGLITLTPNYNDSFREIYSEDSLKKYFSKDQKFIEKRPADFTAINIFGNYPIHFFINGINTANAKKYEYRVTNSSSLNAAWHSINKFADTSIQRLSRLTLAYIGSFNVKNFSQIIVDVKDVSSGKIVSTSVIYRFSIKPVIVNIYLADELDKFLKRLANPGDYHLSTADERKWQKDYSKTELDIFTGLPKMLKLKAPENSIIFYLKGIITDRRQVEYQLEKDNKIYVKWKANDFDNSFIWLKDLIPGNYRLKIRYAFNRDEVLEYPFKITSLWYQSLIFEFLICILILICLVLIFLIFGRRKKEIFEIERRKKLQIDLQIIKSQLNPHFIFNCLNSIQGLVNNNNNIKANTYLSTFAKLLKNTLIYSTETTVPLETELQSIELYLKMEQLRFNFSAQITLDKQINATEVDIPTFLIQPIIENSVKHGIADKGILGKIEIEISIDGKDLTINIKDNGKGYNLNTEYSGYGLKLTNKRIDLLNALNKQKEIMLDIQSSNANGTESKLTFKDWIDEY